MNRRLFRLAAFAILVCALVPPALALDIAVSEFKLANGLRLVVIPNHRAPVVTHMVWYQVGAADEPQGKAGIAHFLEHLMFKGTPKHPAGEFSRLVRVNGGDENAFTTQDYTAYFQKIAKDRLALVMELEADRMQNLVLTDENVLPELQVVREERRQRIENDPSSQLAEQMNIALYTAHPYRKPVIGWMPEVAKLTRADALEFYRAHYEPASATVIVAGDVEAADVKALAEKYYGPLKNTITTPPAIRTEEPEAVAERRVTLHDKLTSAPVWRRSYLAPAEAKAEGREALALQILADALGGDAQSRLYKKIVVEQKLAAYAGSWYNGDTKDYGDFTVYGAPNPGIGVDKLETAIDAVLADVAAHGITQDELDRTLNHVITESVYLLDSQEALARMFGTALMTGQTVADVTDWDKNIAKVTIADVAKAAARIINSKASVTGVLLPEEAP